MDNGDYVGVVRRHIDCATALDMGHSHSLNLTFDIGIQNEIGVPLYIRDVSA